MFAFLTDLVRRKVFLKVKACFLMVGHTHDDIDQLFSVIAGHLKQIHIVCPDQASLFQAIRNAFKTDSEKPIITELKATSLPDYKNLYKDAIDRKIAYHQEPHQFRITCYNEGQPNEIVLVHYKNWAESQFWLPMQGGDQVISEPCDLPHSPPRKKHRGQVTRGQKTELIRGKMLELKENDGNLATELQQMEPENDYVHPDLQACAQDCESDKSSHLTGILWLTKHVAFENAPLVEYSEEVRCSNFQKCIKIYSDIQNNFAKKNKLLFNDKVMANWNEWLTTQKHLWDPNTKIAKTIHLEIPKPYFMRAQSCNPPVAENEIIEDCAVPDLADTVEYVTHQSGEFGSFSKKQRLDIVRAVFVESPQTDEVMLKLACIYKFTYPDMKQDAYVEQIALGVIVKIHQSTETEEESYDIRFCPPVGARPQTATKPDTLYQNIRANMQFNMKYQISSGPKGRKVRVPDIEVQQPKSVLLAYNLVVNSDGFLSRQQMDNLALTSSSFDFAHNVIIEYYKERL